MSRRASSCRKTSRLHLTSWKSKAIRHRVDLQKNLSTNQLPPSIRDAAAAAVIAAGCIARKKKKRLISRKCWKNHSLPASRTAGVDPVSALVTSAVPASHPVTCSQCKYQHKAATAAAAAAPGVYIHCCSRLSLHPSSPSSSLLLLLHASPIPPPASLQPRAATAAA